MTRKLKPFFAALLALLLALTCMVPLVHAETATPETASDAAQNFIDAINALDRDAIRTEQDSCVVAILDERAGIGGRYHDAALAALPICPTTEKIEDVQQFIREQKHPDYFL